jgi:hypothetical protein
MDDTLMTCELYPGVTLPPFARRGRKVMDM